MTSKSFGIIFVVAALCLLFATGCKDPVLSKPIEDIEGIEPPAPSEEGEIPSEEIEPGVWHDESCTCGGTLTFEKLGEGEFVVTCTGNHVLDGATGNEQWKSKFGFPMNTLAEGSYLVSFEAKADLAHTTYLTIGDGSINLVDCAPLQLTTDYKKYNYVFFINANVLGKKNFEFNVLQGNLYVKNLTIENMWAVETETSWKIWQDPSCNDLSSGKMNAGYIAIYEMTEDSVKAIRNTMDMKAPDGWKHQLIFFGWDDRSEGKYRASFTNKSYRGDNTENIVGNIIVQYWDDVAQENVIISNVKGVDGHGKYYFYFDIPKEEEGKPFDLFFIANTYGSWDEHFILEDVKVEKVTQEAEIPDATRLVSVFSKTVEIDDNWTIRYDNWPYDDVTCSNVTDTSITISVPGNAEDTIYNGWTNIAKKPVILNPGETYYGAVNHQIDGEMRTPPFFGLEADNSYVGGGYGFTEIFYTNTTNSPQECHVYFFLDPGCTHTITNLKEAIIQIPQYADVWTPKFVGKGSSSLVVSESSKDSITFTIDGDFDACEIEFALDLEVGKDYTVECNITGPESEMKVGGKCFFSGGYDMNTTYVYIPNTSHNYLSLPNTEWGYTGECVLSFRPEVPGTYTISDITITPYGEYNPSDTPDEPIVDPEDTSEIDFDAIEATLKESVSDITDFDFTGIWDYKIKTTGYEENYRTYVYTAEAIFEVKDSNVEWTVLKAVDEHLCATQQIFTYLKNGGISEIYGQDPSSYYTFDYDEENLTITLTATDEYIAEVAKEDDPFGYCDFYSISVDDNDVPPETTPYEDFLKGLKMDINDGTTVTTNNSKTAIKLFLNEGGIITTAIFVKR